MVHVTSATFPGTFLPQAYLKRLTRAFIAEMTPKTAQFVLLINYSIQYSMAPHPHLLASRHRATTSFRLCPPRWRLHRD